MTQKELREQNRAAVIRAAQGRFLAQSIDKTTIAEIAEDADLTPMSVYRYFGSKQAIAVAVANHLLDAYLAEHSARCEAARSGAPENGYETFSRILGVSEQQTDRRIMKAKYSLSVALVADRGYILSLGSSVSPDKFK